MIENVNASKNSSSSESYVDVKKYMGVASVNVLRNGINPSNATLRLYGWQIPEDAEEPKYVTLNNEGKKSARVRFLVQIQDLEDKPVIALDFWIRPDIVFNRDQTKCKVIDSFGRTAFGTKSELQAHKIPMYSNGPALISSDYKPCHVGEEELVRFIMKYLNVTPLKVFDKNTQQLVDAKHPGRMTIDHWDRLCNGDVSELEEYMKMQPDNRVKVILGIRTTDDNKSYQTFLNTVFLGNGSFVDKNTGEYAAARKAIDKYNEGRTTTAYMFAATPVKEWIQVATEVKDNSEVVEDMPDFSSPEFFKDDPTDMPFPDSL